jgi:hypothetical protein
MRRKPEIQQREKRVCLWVTSKAKALLGWLEKKKLLQEARVVF